MAKAKIPGGNDLCYWCSQGDPMKNQTANLVMSKELRTIPWNAPMGEALQLMDDYRIRHLPVTDFSQAVIGIISERDVNRAMNPRRPGFSPDCQVSDFMSWPVISVDEERPIKDVAEGMVTEKISAILVTAKNKGVIGIITSEDLLRFLIRGLEKDGTNKLLNFTYTPLVAELLRETESVGL
jgi:CBS domain-containing protein